jgi:hypothetical protein
LERQPPNGPIRAVAFLGGLYGATWELTTDIR